MNQSAQSLQEKIDSHTAVIGVIGLGYVGLPLALTFSEAGFPVLGFDVDQTKIDALGRSECYIGHLDPERLEAAIASSCFSATTDFTRLGDPDVLLICVPTPLTEDKQPDLSYVTRTTEAIAATLRPGQLVVLESTTYPGTTEEELLPALSAGDLTCGTDFFLAYSPERENPGTEHSTATTPKVVGGIDEPSGDLAEALYATIVPQAVRVSSTAVAEATKLTENIFRAVNIALVNELKMVYDKLGVDIWEVLDAAETKPFGFMRFNPGPGWGGHCIPIDPFYLSWKAGQAGAEARFIELAGEINTGMPLYVVSKLAGALADAGRSLEGARVLVIGVAYKKDVDDPRESPSFEVIDRLLAAGAQVSYHDPYIPTLPSMRSWPDLPSMASIDLTEESLNAHDVTLVLTDHSNIDFEHIARFANLVVDTRGALSRSETVIQS